MICVHEYLDESSDMEQYDFILETVQKAGTLLLEKRTKGFTISTKENDVRNIVTSADETVNEFLEGEIRRVFPDHSIYSEESKAYQTDSDYQWTLDPLDGSSNFARDIPHYAVCLGVLTSGVPTAGAVYNPVTNELFSFRKGKGAFLNGSKIQVSSVTDMSKAEILFSGGGRDKNLWEWGVSVYRTLLTKVAKRGLLGCSSLDVCFVAAGRVEACVYGTLTALDIAPAFGILEEAGGIARNEEGKPLVLSSFPQKTYVANSTVFLETLHVLLKGSD